MGTEEAMTLPVRQSTTVLEVKAFVAVKPLWHGARPVEENDRSYYIINYI